MGFWGEDIEGITAQDKLRTFLADPNSEYALIMSDDQKKEFILHILRLVSIGGSMCQAEQQFTEYKEATKAMYKDLVCIERGRNGHAKISSTVYHIDPSGRDPSIFPIESSHNKCYAVLNEDEIYTNVTFIYKPFEPFW